MAQIPRGSVVSILNALLTVAKANAARANPRGDYHKGRVSGLETALDVLAMDEDEVLPPVRAANKS